MIINLIFECFRSGDFRALQLYNNLDVRKSEPEERHEFVSPPSPIVNGVKSNLAHWWERSSTFRSHVQPSSNDPPFPEARNPRKSLDTLPDALAIISIVLEHIAADEEGQPPSARFACAESRARTRLTANLPTSNGKAVADRFLRTHLRLSHSRDNVRETTMLPLTGACDECAVDLVDYMGNSGFLHADARCEAVRSRRPSCPLACMRAPGVELICSFPSHRLRSSFCHIHITLTSHFVH